MKKFDSVDFLKKALFFVSCVLLAFIFWCVVKYNEVMDIVPSIKDVIPK